MKKILLALICFTLTCSTSFAEALDLPYGASSLGHLNMAATVNLGLDIPSLMIVQPRFDLGLGSRFQTGLGGFYTPGNDSSYWINVTSYNKFVAFRSSNDHHALSVNLDPSYTYLNETDSGYLFTLSPSVAYEYLFLGSKPAGVYFRLGTTSVVASSWEGAEDSYEFFTLSTRKNSHLLNAVVGFEKAFTTHFHLGAELGGNMRINNRSTNATFAELFKFNQILTAKIMLGWVF